MLCRSASRGEAARQKLIHASGNEHIYLCCVDLSDLDRVQDEKLFAEIPHIDVLVHNAGVLLEQRSISAQGIEQTLATHLVGPFALTATPMPKMGRGSRVIWVSSGGMYTQKLNMRHLEEPPDPFDGVRAYAQVKRAMVIASEHLAAAVEPCGITVHCMHPGWASTPGVKTSISPILSMDAVHFTHAGARGGYHSLACNVTSGSRTDRRLLVRSSPCHNALFASRDSRARSGLSFGRRYTDGQK